MNMGKSSDHLAAPLLTRSLAPSAGSMTETSSPGRPVHFNGGANSLPGGVSVEGLFAILLLAAVTLTPFARLTLLGTNGRKSSRCTTSHFQKQKRNGGTGTGHCE